MKYSAILMILMGAVVACAARVREASDGPPEWAENPFVLGLAFPPILAAALLTTGTALWVIGGRWSTFSGRRPAEAPGDA